MQAGTAGVMFCSAENFLIRVWEGLILADEVDDVDAETVCAAIQPEPHHVVGGFADRWIFPVQVGLFFAKQAEVVFICGFVIFPCTSCI